MKQEAKAQAGIVEGQGQGLMGVRRAKDKIKRFNAKA
jgi:hypothetical protein